MSEASRCLEGSLQCLRHIPACATCGCSVSPLSKVLRGQQGVGCERPQYLLAETFGRIPVLPARCVPASATCCAVHSLSA